MDWLEWIAKASNENFVTHARIEYIYSCRYFSLDKKYFVREFDSGINVFSYWFAKHEPVTFILFFNKWFLKQGMKRKTDRHASGKIGGAGAVRWFSTDTK